MNALTFIFLAFVGYLIVMATLQGGSSPAPRRTARKTRKTAPTGQKINVNVNGRHARTIVIKQHTRTIG
jgi:hypothetical protein